MDLFSYISFMLSGIPCTKEAHRNLSQEKKKKKTVEFQLLSDFSSDHL